MSFRASLSLLCAALLAPACGAPRFTVDSTTVSVETGERVLLRYRYAEVPFKPYAKELYSPKGVNVLRDAPHDHLHHHALMYAIAVEGVNFWEEGTAPGAQRHLSLDDLRVVSEDAARFSERLSWVNPRSAEHLLDEVRALRVEADPEGPVTLLSWESLLAAPRGRESVTLTGNHYHGLGMRFPVSMDKGGGFFSARGDLGVVYRGTERLGEATWCAYTAEADGSRVTVAMFGHPDNIRGPTLWFTMTEPFAYLSATLNLHENPIVIQAGAPLRLRYAVAVWDGRVDAPAVERAYGSWVARK